MSPVFRHGRLRLYLLKLLDESPRHGYEVIRLLQDRFMGVYAPSPGTIYPRLARLEEEGLVTHDEADGRKVYRITDKGREELRSRPDDLSELEDEITASVRDIAREVTEDVRETVRNLREELTFAARDMHRRGTPPPRGSTQGGSTQGGSTQGGRHPGRQQPRQDQPRRQPSPAQRRPARGARLGGPRDLPGPGTAGPPVHPGTAGGGVAGAGGERGCRGGPAGDPGRHAGPDQGRGLRRPGAPATQTPATQTRRRKALPGAGTARPASPAENGSRTRAAGAKIGSYRVP